MGGGTSLELEPLVLVLLDVSQGLEYLHSRGVIHGACCVAVPWTCQQT